MMRTPATNGYASAGRTVVILTTDPTVSGKVAALAQYDMPAIAKNAANARVRIESRKDEYAYAATITELEKNTIVNPYADVMADTIISTIEITSSGSIALPITPVGAGMSLPEGTFP